MTVATPHKLMTEWLTEQSEIVPIEKSRDNQFSVNDIQGSLREFAGLFKAGYASPAMILTLYRAYPDNLLYKEVVTERNLLEEDPLVVGGPASVEMIDHEGHLITADALSKAYDKYMENPMTRNVMVMHSDIQVGWALPAYIGRNGQVFKGGMNNKTLFFISELRKDTKISKKVTEQVYKSKMRSYSIAGSAIKTENVAGNLIKGEKPYMRVDELELAEVTICEKGVNQGASFDLIKSHDHATKSCADGSCLITKSTMSAKPHEALQTQTLSFSDYKNMLADTNGDNKSFVEMFKEYTDMNISKGRSKELQEKGLRRQTGDASRRDEAEDSYEATSEWHTGQPGGMSEEEAGFKSKTAAQHKATDRMHNKPTKGPDMNQRLANHKSDKEAMDEFPGHYLHNTPRGKKYAESKGSEAVQKAVWEAFGMDVEKANTEMKWGQPSSADKPNTQARKQGLIRGVPEKAGDAAKKASPKPHQVESDPISGQDDEEFQQKGFSMTNERMEEAVWAGFEDVIKSDEDYDQLEKGLRSAANKLKNTYRKVNSAGERRYKKGVVDSLRSKTRRAGRAEEETGTTATEQARTRRAGTKAYNKAAVGKSEAGMTWKPRLTYNTSTVGKAGADAGNKAEKDQMKANQKNVQSRDFNYYGEAVQKAVWAAFEEAGLFEKASSEGKKLQQRAGLQATRGKIDTDAMSSSEKADFNNKADANMKEANKRDPGLMYSAPQNVTSKDNRRYRAEIAAAGKGVGENSPEKNAARKARSRLADWHEDSTGFPTGKKAREAAGLDGGDGGSHTRNQEAEYRVNQGLKQRQPEQVEKGIRSGIKSYVRGVKKRTAQMNAANESTARYKAMRRNAKAGSERVKNMPEEQKEGIRNAFATAAASARQRRDERDQNSLTMRGASTPETQAKARKVSGENRYKNNPAGEAARARDTRDTSGDVKFMQQTKNKQRQGEGLDG